MEATSEPAAGSPGREIIVDLAGELRSSPGGGALWRLGSGEDLQANLVRIEPGHEIGAHRNDEVDVLLLVVEGSGELQVDQRFHPLAPATLAHLPKGSVRAIRAGDLALVYLSIHRRRGGLAIGRPPAPGEPESGRSGT
jgi:quercetin dioxygenase-like cupin family protein